MAGPEGYRKAMRAMARAGLDVLGEHLEPDVGVDPPLARTTCRRPGLERQPGCVREQVPHGGSFGSRGLVQVDHALLGGHERGEGSHGLGHGGPAKLVLPRTVGRHRFPREDHPGRGGGGRPAVELTQSTHGRRY